MSKNSIHRKLKLAYTAIIENNKVMAITKPQEERFSRNYPQTKCASLCIIGDRLAAPALSLLLKNADGINLEYYFNLTFGMNRHVGTKRSLSGLFFTKLDFNNQGHGCLPLVASQFLSSPVSAEPIPCEGPPGLSKYLSSVYRSVLSQKMFKRFFDRVNISGSCSEYTGRDITIKKVLCPSSVNGKDCSYSKATVSYVCQVNFSPELDWDALANLYQPLPRDEGIWDPESSHREEQDKFLNRLKRGENATVPGTDHMINAEEVLKPPCSSILGVIDCPTKQHFECLVESPVLTELQSGATELSPSVIVHITPSGIFSSSIYQQWLAKFGKDCKHLVISEENKLRYFETEHVQIYTFHKICDKVFPPVRNEFVQSAKVCFGEGNIAKANSGLTFDISTRDGEEWYCKHNMDKSWAAATGALERASEILEDADFTNFKVPGDQDYYPRLFALGTGSAYNHKYRSQPGFLIMLDKKNSVLLDCGERTLEKIYFIFGDDAENVLASIRLILLSHSHLDHHICFTSVVQQVIEAQHTKNTCKKIFCLMPQQMCAMYEKFTDHMMGKNNIVFCPLLASGPLEHEMKASIEEESGLRSVTPVRVLHSIVTYGISLVTGCGKKIVYSSDTLPMCKDLIANGKNADLLIHDCLYTEDEFEEEAGMRKHSTLKGALRTSHAMRAKFTLLTHFSPHLPVQPSFLIPEMYQGKVAAAYDFLSVSLADLHELPKLQPLMHAVYRNSTDKYNLNQTRRKYNVARRKALARNLTALL